VTVGPHDTRHGRILDDDVTPPERGADGLHHLLEVGSHRGIAVRVDLAASGERGLHERLLGFRDRAFVERGQQRVEAERGIGAQPDIDRVKAVVQEAHQAGVPILIGFSRRFDANHLGVREAIQNGEIGEINLLRGYRMAGPLASAFSERWPGKPSELLWQIQRFHSFIWASGGCFSDFYIHHIDHLCMMKNAWPVKAQALGGRHYRNTPEGRPYVDQNFDSYSVEYTFEDGAKMYMDGRCMIGAEAIYSSYAHGSKGMAVVSKNGDCGLPSSTYKTQTPQRDAMIWTSEVDAKEKDPYLNEWNDLMDAIRNDKPYNEAKRGVEASLVTSMGRRAAHTGQEIRYEDMLNSEEEFCPNADKLTLDSPPPVKSDADGKYPVPMPGIKKDREY